jgi:hypothetical protein
MTRRTKQGARAGRASKKSKPKKISARTNSEISIAEEVSEMEMLEMAEPLFREGHRSHRSRPTPSWLLEQQNHDEIAKRRVLMVLRVLSGETPVTDAIEGTDISRQTYYQLEERALRAMMRALTPGGEAMAVSGPDPAMLRRMGELEMRNKQLEQEKRRAERMLYLTRKVVPTGPMKSNRRGRPPKAPSSVTGGASDSRVSKMTKNSTSRDDRAEDGTADSIRRPSAVEPHGGTAS